MTVLPWFWAGSKDNRTLLEKKAEGLLAEGDVKAAKVLGKMAAKAEAWAQKGKAKGDRLQPLYQGMEMLAGIVDGKKGEILAGNIISLSNTNDNKWLLLSMKELFAEITGMTDENRAVYQWINRAKYAVSSVRQDHRQKVPKILASKFSRKLTKTEWSRLHLGLGRTDIAALAGIYSLDDLRKVISDGGFRSKEVARLEEVVTSLGGRNQQIFLKKAQELARFMVTGEIDPANHNLLKNAEAIANLLGETNPRTGKPLAGVTSVEMIEAVNQLTTLYAIDALDPSTLGTMETLIRDEADGIDFLTAYLTDVRTQEKAKATTPAARLNGWKGYIPSEKRDAASLIVADDSEGPRLRALGYTRVGDHKGSAAEGGKRGYYHSTISGREMYQQGAMQTVQTSAMGVDPRAGRTLTGTVAGVIRGQELSLVLHRIQRGVVPRGEPLIPIYDDKEQVAAYERSMSPQALQSLQRNTHLGEMLGAWSGRQVEEKLA